MRADFCFDILHFMKQLFSVTGIVQHGDHKGTELGFPTANISCPNFIPNGIFAGEVILNDTHYPAAIYRHPKRNVLEAHILDFYDDIYGKEITIIGIQKTRGYKRFNSEEMLIETITHDIIDIRECLQQYRIL